MCYHASLTGSYFRITDYNDIQAQPQLELWGHGVHVCVCVTYLCISLGLTRPVVSLVRKWGDQLKLPQAVVSTQDFLFIP